MARQDEKQRIRRRMQDYALELAANNAWEEAIDVNTQILELGDDPASQNRLGKAYLEMGMYAEALTAYQKTLELNPTNTIARKNIARLESLLSRGIQQASNRQTRQQVDLRFFITEAGKTMLTALTDVPRNPAVDVLSAGERVDIKVEGRQAFVADVDGNIIGRIEPKIGQRLTELINGGNRYIAAIVQSDPRQVRILIREIYQDPSQRGRTSFPGRLADASMYEYLTMRYDYESDDLIEEDEPPVEAETLDEDLGSNEEEEEIRLDTIESDLSDEDDGTEE